LWIACPPSNTGAKYNDEVFQFSVGLNGVGTKAVNALSDVFVVRSIVAENSFEANFKRGKAQEREEGQRRPSRMTARMSSFEPDTTIFKETDFKPEHLERRLRHYSYLNTGLRLIFENNGDART